MLCRKMLAHALAFWTDTKGNIVILFVMMMPLILLAAGMAIDMSRAVHARSELQEAADMAVLLGAKENFFENKDWDKKSIKAFKSRSLKMKFKGKPKVSIEEKGDGTIVIDATGQLRPSFMQIFGYPKLEVSVTAAAAVGDPAQKMEIVFVMDFSDSMSSNGKLGSAKTAVGGFLDQLDAMQSGDTIKASLVPFAGTIGVTLPQSMFVSPTYFSDFDGSMVNSSITTCTGDRVYPYNTTDDAPVATNDNTKFGVYAGGFFQWDPDVTCKDEIIDKNLIVEPLTNDMGDLKTKLDKMAVSTYTHLALGMSFGQHILSPNAPYTEAALFTDEDVKKILIFLTDGAQTTPAHTPLGWSGGSWDKIYEAKHRMTDVCNNLKLKDVEIYIVAYDFLSGTAASYLEGDETEVLKDCSSGSEYYFDPGYPESEITAAFEAIFEHATLGEQYGELRLVR